MEEDNKKDNEVTLVKVENTENKENNLIFQPNEDIKIEGFENQYSLEKEINLWIYIIPEVIFIICFISGSFYKFIYNFMLFSPYGIIIIISNSSFFVKGKYYFKNYLLISKLTSIEILFLYSILII